MCVQDPLFAYLNNERPSGTRWPRRRRFRPLFLVNWNDVAIMERPADNHSRLSMMAFELWPLELIRSYTSGTS